PSSAIPNGLINPNAESRTPLCRQLYDPRRRAILAGQLAAGARLQATREMAGELNVSRNTIVNAYEQLLAEGYLEGQVGSGTYVSRALPEEFLNVKAVARSSARTLSKGPGLPKRGNVFAAFAESIPRSSQRARAF